jgi:thiol:disulfide interchange protein DsbD
VRKSVKIAALALVLMASAVVRAQIAVVGNGGPGPVKTQHLTAELVSLGPAIAPGGQQTVGLVLTMEEHWHVYWVNAGDSGEPPKIAWTLPAGFSAGPMQFPIPDRLPLGPLMDYGYEEEAAFPVTITAPGDAQSGAAHLDAQVSWLVCADVCVPGKAHLGIDLNVQPGAPGAAQEPLLGALGQAITLLPKPLPAGAKFSATGDAKRFALTLIDGKRATDADFFPYVDAPSAKDLKDSAPVDAIVNAAVQGVEPLDDGVRIYVQRSPDAASLPAQLSGIVKLSDTLAYEVSAPVTQVSDVYAAARAGDGSTSSRAASITTLGAIGLAFVGGMILNLMPCVFPVLFLKGLALAQTAGAQTAGVQTVNAGGESDRRHLLRHGLVYALGILVSFWAIVVVLLGLRAGGTHVGWGFQLQSPAFLAVLASGLFFLALSLAGQFDVGLSLTSAGGELAQRQGYAGSFFTGVLATVVATPCTAPLMGAAIGFALAQSAGVTFAVFTALALGLAAPYVLLSWQPAWAKLLPKPGAWMEVFKQATAAIFFATAIWLAWVYGQIEEARGGGEGGVTQIALLLGCFLLVAIAGWALGRWPARWGSAIAAVVLIALGLAIPLSQGRAKMAGSASAGTNSSANLDVAWQPYSEAALQAAHAAGRPVFLNFTAAWCLSCHVNERVVLKAAEVEAALRKGNFVTMTADWTNEDPAITQKLESVGRDGVPTYILYPAATGSAADVLPEVLTRNIVLQAIERDAR